MIKLKLLYFFKIAVEEGSISAASARLFIAQPALSKALRNLEQYFDVQLFERSSKGVKITQVDQYLYQKACYLLSEATKLD
ncbi:LysR family transcriptional regulator [Utexia brackfieldae]|uniref:LysR family transcriptional regulator n=1 Tax=Utexia brackfieldae TaxID=3074108 RepID=UPI00370D5298